MKKLISAVLVVAFFAVTLSFSGCANTWKGVGKDIEEMGKDIQN